MALKVCSFFIVFLLGCSGVARANSCGQAKIISGSHCSNLRIRFFLKSCGGPDLKDAEVTCDPSGAVAKTIDGKKEFFIPVREVAPGVWVLVGHVNQRGVSQALQPTRKEKVLSQTPESFAILGDFRLRSERNKFNDWAADRAFTSLRLRPGFRFFPSDELSFYFQPQANFVLGEPDWIAATESTQVKVGMSGSNRDPRLTVHQAFGDFKLASFWRLILGRQVFSYGEEVLVGASDWENPGTSFDGVRFRFEWQKSFLDLFTTKLWDSNATAGGLRDKSFHGSYFVWAPSGQSYSFEPYLFWLDDSRSATHQFFSSGVFLRLNLNEIELRVEGTGQWGDRTGQQAWFSLLAPLLFQHRIRLGVDGFWSSPQFHPLFPSNHKWLGWADVLARRNLSGLGMEGRFELNTGLELTSRFLYFLRSDVNYSAYQWDGLTALSVSSQAGPHLGAEADFGLRFSVLRGADAFLSAALFFPSSSLRSQISQDWIGRFEAGWEARF